MLPGYAAGDRVQSVVNDPARPSDFYAAAGENDGRNIKWWRSTDFGATWELQNDGDMHGNPWGFSIDPNPCRDPTTPPTLWSPAGYGSFGAWKSTDGAKTWTRATGADTAFGPYNPFGATLTDLYHLQILPDDPPNHVLATYHYGFKDDDDGGLGESWDGGETWVIHQPAEGMGNSHYVIAIGATTWAIIAQDNQGKNGIWRTTTAGRVGGTAGAKFRDGEISTEAWTKVDTHEHVHGSHQNLRFDGVWYATGWTSIKSSSDDGATWQTIGELNISGLAATRSYLYGNYLLAPTLSRAPRDAPMSWEIGYAETPPGMTSGANPFGGASAYDPESGHWVVLMSAGDTGIWRYVEP